MTMTDHRDIEETLKRFDRAPDAETKAEVMSAYRRAFEAGARAGFWRRPVPLYAAAAVIVVLVAASFVAGQRTSMSAGARADRATPGVTDGVVTSQDIEWRPAQNDLL
jgi:hypothetical protein